VSDDETSEPPSFSEPLEVSAPTSSDNTNTEATSEAEMDTNSEEDPLQYFHSTRTSKNRSVM
ncbi:hypothetical protein A2U01_0073089, partial [Trifolium medium]|nr:hypothetical protein [Trifolium medium]